MRGTLTLSELEALAYDLGVDLDLTPTRYTNKRAPARSVQALRQFAAEYGEHPASTQENRIREIRRLAETGAASAHELRDQLREVGIDLGHRTEDREDFENTCRHEAGHAVAAHGLGWHVLYVDARAGETKVEPPADYWDQRITDRWRWHNTIAAAGSVAAGTSSLREENLNDRVAVRSKHGDFKDARKLAEKLLADRWAKPALERLTRALIMVGGRLEGAALLEVLEGDWEGKR